MDQSCPTTHLSYLVNISTGSGSRSRTDSNFLPVLGPVLELTQIIDGSGSGYRKDTFFLAVPVPVNIFITDPVLGGSVCLSC